MDGGQPSFTLSFFHHLGQFLVVSKGGKMVSKEGKEAKEGRTEAGASHIMAWAPGLMSL